MEEVLRSISRAERKRERKEEKDTHTHRERQREFRARSVLPNSRSDGRRASLLRRENRLAVGERWL